MTPKKMDFRVPPGEHYHSFALVAGDGHGSLAMKTAREARENLLENLRKASEACECPEEECNFPPVIKAIEGLEGPFTHVVSPAAFSVYACTSTGRKGCHEHVTKKVIPDLAKQILKSFVTRSNEPPPGMYL